MKLIMDLGNTTQKYFFFEGKQLTGKVLLEGKVDVATIRGIIESYGPFSSAILSSVVKMDERVLAEFRCIEYFLVFNYQTPVPIRNLYATPETLGPDRLAAAIGGYMHFTDHPVLVIDAGTCIKYELVAGHTYRGGIIAPGLSMQAKALHTFTDKLPLVIPVADNDVPLAGLDTKGSLMSGIINATLASMEGIIGRFMDSYPDLKIILTGGDLKYFDKRLKYSIFALPNLVAVGLNKILDFNEKHR